MRNAELIFNSTDFVVVLVLYYDEEYIGGDRSGGDRLCTLF